MISSAYLLRWLCESRYVAVIKQHSLRCEEKNTAEMQLARPTGYELDDDGMAQFRTLPNRGDCERWAVGVGAVAHHLHYEKRKVPDLPG